MVYPFTITGGVLGTDYTIDTDLSTSQVIISFKTAGKEYTFKPTQQITQGNYLVVGGGGAGGGNSSFPFNYGGGGGGGEVSQQSNITFNSLETYTIFVGEGGLVGTAVQGNNGTPSYISSASLNINCLGGEGGFTDNYTQYPSYGGNSYLGNGNYYSGGGGSYYGGGGGGAGNGGNGYPSSGYSGNGGNGGIGVISTITGNSIYFSGGGGGGAFSNTSVSPDGSIIYFGQGGLGGGGNGGQGDINSFTGEYSATTGTANSGGGGGGGSIGSGIVSFLSGAAGGSGIVILSYSTSPSSSLQLTFKGSETFEMVDSYTNLFSFTSDNTTDPKTVILFDASINSVPYTNCSLTFTLSGTTKETLSKVTLSVPANGKTYNLIYNPYDSTTKQIKTYYNYTNSDDFPFPYNYVIQTSPNEWDFSTSNTDNTNNKIIYDKETNSITAISSSVTYLYENIGTLGMCGASNAFINGASPETQDTINASIAWCFYSLYGVTGYFTQ